jgi:hypothetical protein
MTSKMLRAAAVTAVAVTSAVGVATAATPDSGTVSNAEPLVEWGGSTTSGALILNAWENDPTTPCPPAQGNGPCDSYALTVGDKGTVDVTAKPLGQPDDGSTASIGVRVEKPDGSIAYTSGEGEAKLALENADKGDYTVTVADAFICCGPQDYQASAAMRGAAPPADGGGEQTPPAQNPPAQNPPAGSQPAPQQQSQPSTTPTDFTLTAKAPKVRGKARSFKVGVSTSRSVERVTVTLRKGSKTVGSGKLAPFPGKAKIKVKASRKLAKGSYKLVVVGQDGGVTVARTLSLKVR